MNELELIKALLCKTDGNKDCDCNRDDIFVIGEKYFIRTVTMAITGKLKKITDNEILLENGAWIASTGRFATALKTGEFDEVEPFPGDVIVGRGAIVDACRFDFSLPREQK